MSGIDEGQSFSGLHLVPHGLKDNGNRTGYLGGEVSDPCGVESQLAVGGNKVLHGLLLHDAHVHAGLDRALGGGELDASFVKRVAAVVSI